MLAILIKSKMADALGKVEEMIDEAIRGFPFVRREGKSFFIDLVEALQVRVKGMRVKEFALADGTVNITFYKPPQDRASQRLLTYLKSRPGPRASS